MHRRERNVLTLKVFIQHPFRLLFVQIPASLQLSLYRLVLMKHGWQIRLGSLKNHIGILRNILFWKGKNDCHFFDMIYIFFPGPHKHQSAVTCLQFNKNFVITSSDDGTVKLWDLKTGEFIRNLVTLESGGSGGVVWRIRASNTKLVCAVGSRNGTEETKLLVLDFGVDMKWELGGVGHVWRAKRADRRDEGTESEWWGAWKPEGQHPELFTQTRKICWHSRKRLAVLSSLASHLLGVKRYWRRCACFYPFHPLTAGRRLEAQPQGNKRSVPGMSWRRGRKNTTIELFGSDSPPFRFRVSFAETWRCKKPRQMLRCTERYYFLKSSRHTPFLTVAPHRHTHSNSQSESSKGAPHIGKDLRKVGWGEFPHSVTPKVLLGIVEWKEVLGAFIFFTPFPFLFFSTRFL